MTPEGYLADLMWVINSPSMLRPATNVAIMPKVSESQIDREHLAGWIRDHSISRLGRYFERLIEYYLRFVARVGIEAQQHQVRAQGRTIGELDFVFRDSAGRLIHWEVAAKFYLWDPASAETAPRDAWLGPNANDRLHRKLQRMFQHQLPLGNSVEPKIERSLAVVKGRLFSPLATAAPPPSREPLAPDHLRGHYVRFAEAAQQLDPAATYRIIPKPHWLSPQAARVAGDPPRDLTAFLKRLQEPHPQRPRLVLKTFDGDASTTARWLFVVPDRWPAR